MEDAIMETAKSTDQDLTLIDTRVDPAVNRKYKGSISYKTIRARQLKKRKLERRNRAKARR